jgi:hypothetical protein
VFTRPALFASAGFSERVTALQFGQLLFQVHAVNYKQGVVPTIVTGRTKLS